jgi:hypothetical protein
LSRVFEILIDSARGRPENTRVQTPTLTLRRSQNPGLDK